MEIFEKLKGLVLDIETDTTKFYEKSNNAAGTRVRKAMQEVKKLAQELRVDVQTAKNAAV